MNFDDDDAMRVCVLVLVQNCVVLLQVYCV